MKTKKRSTATAMKRLGKLLAGMEQAWYECGACYDGHKAEYMEKTWTAEQATKAVKSFVRQLAEERG